MSTAHLELLVVHAWNHTQIAKLADVILPTSTYAEKEGTLSTPPDWYSTSPQPW
ncbi:MAG: molybdopterin-dependent oxidoreductase [Chlorobi bacterium]|nr:molybdopterin-dependent oxidoreductase [Chlorobiota bacterium]